MVLLPQSEDLDARHLRRRRPRRLTERTADPSVLDAVAEVVDDAAVPRLITGADSDQVLGRRAAFNKLVVEGGEEDAEELRVGRVNRGAIRQLLRARPLRLKESRA